MTKQISITRALVELKRLGERIQTQIGSSAYLGVQVGKGTYAKTGTEYSVEKVKADVQNSYNSLTDLITERQKIKSAIVKANANTIVTFGGKEMTIAEAIEMKNSIGYKRQMVTAMKNQYTRAQSTVTSQNAALEKSIEQLITTMLGADKASNKVDPEAAKAIANPQREMKETSLIDPLNLGDKIKQLEEEISLVDSELDFTLSEVNAKTVIEV